MEILATISSLLSVGESLLSFKHRFITNKENIISWLLELADLVESVAHDLEAGIYPHSKCAQIEFYMTSFYDILKKQLEPRHTKKLFDLMQQSCQVEKLLGELNNLTPKEKQYNIIIMLGAAGNYRGLANYLKLKKV